jgi:hypothetical protein
MRRKPRQRDAKHDFCRAGRPAVLGLDNLQPFEEAADVDDERAELGAERLRATGAPRP